ncbi:hypothetical protein A3962_04425 [Meiothermus taiwanensis]|nr:hypothetical protein A3962_04425 [Meiothermus taiwanensis]
MGAAAFVAASLTLARIISRRLALPWLRCFRLGWLRLSEVGVAALVQVGSGAVAPAGWAGLAPIVDGLLARVVALQAVLAALVRVEVAVLDPAGWSAAALLDWANSARAGRDPAHLDWMKAVRGLAGFHPFDRGVLRPG